MKDKINFLLSKYNTLPIFEIINDVASFFHNFFYVLVNFFHKDHIVGNL
mgnify:CR=1 FL=1